MNAKHSLVVAFAATSMLSSFTEHIDAAPPQATLTIPDFTRGDQIPDGATHDWNLGPTGARGWMFSRKLETSEARQIYVTRVEKNSPAGGLLLEGDVILGVSGKAFSFDPRTELGKAIGVAEATDGKLALTVWRSGKTATKVLQLRKLGAYAATAPYDCSKSQRILERGCRALAERVADESYRSNPITRSLNALALLASGNDEYLPLVKKEAQWASGFSADSFQTWHYGYVIMLLAEYAMVSGDDSVMPGLRRLALEAAQGQSAVGSWGHRFARPDGRLGGYGMMNAPGLPLTISLILAREAGVDDPELDQAIQRSARLIRFYVGKGSVPYGDHHPWIQTHEDNGKNGMAAVMFHLLGDSGAAEFFSRMSVASHGGERDTGHTGNFFNILWAMPGVALSGPQASGAWMEEFGWHYDLARRWDGTYLHQGPPGTRPDRYRGWDGAGAYLLAYAQPLRKLHITGKRHSVARHVDAATAESLIADGRGWSPRLRIASYADRSESQIFAGLRSWSPVVRERSAQELARRDGDPTSKLIAMLGEADLDARLGACQALILLKNRAAPAVDTLKKTLAADDLWLRIKAAEALASIGQAAMKTLPDLLAMLADRDRTADPRGMQQRYLCFALFNQRGGMLGRSLDGVDRELLYAAVKAGLRNEDGRARGSIGSVYRNLSYEEIEPLLPAIHRAVVEPAPSGIMFANGIRLSGLAILAKHRIAEGVPLCLDVMDIDSWGKKDRITKCLEALQVYGGAARPMLPRLEKLEKSLLAHREAKGLRPQIDLVRQTMAAIVADEQSPQLRSIGDIGMGRGE